MCLLIPMVIIFYDLRIGMNQKEVPCMLILTRRIGEVVAIGDDIRLTILGIRGNQVRMGVRAPADVAVHREEIYKRVLAERREAAAETV